MTDPRQQRVPPFSEIGVQGAHISGGFVHEDFLNQLVGDRGRRTYRQMRDNDPTISAFLFAVEMLFRAVEWTVSVDAEGPEAEEKKEFLESVLFGDMSHSWDDFVGQVASMLTFGWQYTEVVYKKRVGPNEKNPARRSNYTDGLIGVRKLADRSQETLSRWEIDPDTGEVFGLWQQPPVGGQLRYIPMEKALLFRPHQHKGSPEGRSVLRGAYVPWYNKYNLEQIELIAAERELNGLPVVYIPGEMLASTDPSVMAQVDEYRKIVRDVKLNSQSGLVLSSATYRDREGAPSNVPMVKFELLSTKGSRAIDLDKSIKRYDLAIARTVLADFIMLGQTEKGSFALSRSKVELFARALEGWLESIAQTVNHHLVPNLWRLNGFPLEDMPYLVPGKVVPEDIGELGDYVESLSRAGVTIFDSETEDHLRRAGGLPEAPVGEHANTIPDDRGPQPESEPEDRGENADEDLVEG